MPEADLNALQAFLQCVSTVHNAIAADHIGLAWYNSNVLFVRY